MRPEHFYSGNRFELGVKVIHGLASMRPEHFYSGNLDPGFFLRKRYEASMRPEHFYSGNLALVFVDIDDADMLQ